MSNAKRGMDDVDILAIIILALVAMVLCGCSHLGQVKSAEAKAATEQKNLDLAKAAKLMRISDYGQEAKYGISLMPVTPLTKAEEEILSLQIALAGSGKMTEAQREDFFNIIAKDDLDARRALYQAGKDDADKDKKIADLNTKVSSANAVVKAVTESAASVADQADGLIHWAIAAFVVILILIAIRVIILWSQTAATVASKVP